MKRPSRTTAFVSFFFSGVILLCLITPRLHAGNDHDLPQREKKEPPQFQFAVTKAPKWMTVDSPFDMAKFFTPPKPEDNAAPLYLDAMFEFSYQVRHCFPEAERNARMKKAQNRASQIADLYDLIQNHPEKVSNNQIDSLLKELEMGFRKIEKAQQKSQCMFTTDLGVMALLGHIDCTGRICIAYDLKIMRETQNGEIGKAIRSLKNALRIICDMRRRGFALTQISMDRLEQMLLHKSMTRILASPNISVNDCDVLLKKTREHENHSVNTVEEGLKADYASARYFLFQIHFNRFVLRKNWQKKMEREDNPSIARMLIENLGVVVTSDQQNFDFDKLFKKIKRQKREIEKQEEVIKKLDKKSYDRELKILNDVYKDQFRLRKMFYTARQIASKKLNDKIAKETTILEIAFGSGSAFFQSCERQRASLGAAKCLIALRRFQLENGNVRKSSLKEILRRAGISKIPEDPFSEGGLKLRFVNGKPVIYSFGPDRLDDKAEIEADRDKHFGDLVYRLKSKIRE